MRLKEARVRKYRSIRDTGWFDVEDLKTILVGPNEAGKTVLLQALQQINPPAGTRPLKALRDYPRSEYNDIMAGRVDPKDVTVVEAKFKIEAEDVDSAGSFREFEGATLVVGRKLDNTQWSRLEGGPPEIIYSSIAPDLHALAELIDARKLISGQNADSKTCISKLRSITEEWDEYDTIDCERADKLSEWMLEITGDTGESSAEEVLIENLSDAIYTPIHESKALYFFMSELPLFVYFNNYFWVRPKIHLEHLAQRVESEALEEKYFDYGNNCLLRLLGFTARELADKGKAPEPDLGDEATLEDYQDQLDDRNYQLNAASIKLTEDIRKVWVPVDGRAEADQLRVTVDQQYLKVVVLDGHGVEVELDQRSAGFQWMVSFFIVFFAETEGEHKNSILLLDEPGLSLHGLKQREFRKTISLLAEHNQTLYTTHSPFLVGPDELDLVRVVEMTNRDIGTQVHTQVLASDPGALLPLQLALGYDLAQSLFLQQRNLVLEGLTDYWYVESVAQLLRHDGKTSLNETIALVPAGDAGKVVYFATILSSSRLKVAALLDSDSAGEKAAQQDTLVHLLRNRGILRTKDVYGGAVNKPEIEDLLRDTLIQVAKDDLGWNVEDVAASQPARPIVDIFADEITGFSKYKLAKAFLRWARVHEATDLTVTEQTVWIKLVKRINTALR